MADMDPIMELAARSNLYVIEDAAQAIGAEDKGRRGDQSATWVVSVFFPSKNLGGFGDGGMVTSNDPVLADQVKLLRNHGYRPKYYNKIVGGNFRLDAIQAAVLRIKLKYLDKWTEGRQRNAATYRRLFAAAAINVQAGMKMPARLASSPIAVPKAGISTINSSSALDGVTSYRLP